MVFMLFVNMLLLLFFVFSANMVQMVYLLMMNIFVLVLMISYFMKMSWFMMLFMIMMISGLLVMFSYMTSLSVGKKLGFNFINLFTVILIIILILSKCHMLDISLLFSYSNEIDFFSVFFCVNFCFVLMFLIMLMLIMLVVNIELISSFKNSFRIF